MSFWQTARGGERVVTTPNHVGLGPRAGVNNDEALCSTPEGVHQILDLEAQVVALPILLQPERTMSIETALLCRLAHEGSLVCQLYESRDPIL